MYDVCDLRPKQNEQSSRCPCVQPFSQVKGGFPISSCFFKKKNLHVAAPASPCFLDKLTIIIPIIQNPYHPHNSSKLFKLSVRVAHSDSTVPSYIYSMIKFNHKRYSEHKQALIHGKLTDAAQTKSRPNSISLRRQTQCCLALANKDTHIPIIPHYHTKCEYVQHLYGSAVP